ncbi:hypothetical protein DFH06DRAFT_1234287 [Mycena polygramma]|nr:hypothetical protein DFH06DRAFT_1234287 [Mycena polygramma]
MKTKMQTQTTPRKKVAVVGVLSFLRFPPRLSFVVGAILNSFLLIYIRIISFVEPRTILSCSIALPLMLTSPIDTRTLPLQVPGQSTGPGWLARAVVRPPRISHQDDRTNARQRHTASRPLWLAAPRGAHAAWVQAQVAPERRGQRWGSGARPDGAHGRRRGGVHAAL